MSDHRDVISAPVMIPLMAPLLAFGKQSLDLWRRSSALGPDGVEVGALFGDLRQLRGHWFMYMSQTMDACMRTPAFLDLMRHNLTALTSLATLTRMFSLPLR